MAEGPPACRGVLLRVLDHKLDVSGRAGDEGLVPTKDLVVFLGWNVTIVQGGSHPRQAFLGHLKIVPSDPPAELKRSPFLLVEARTLAPPSRRVLRIGRSGRSICAIYSIGPPECYPFSPISTLTLSPAPARAIRRAKGTAPAAARHMASPRVRLLAAFAGPTAIQDQLDPWHADCPGQSRATSVFCASGWRSPSSARSDQWQSGQPPAFSRRCS